MHGYGYFINETGIKRNGEWYDDKRVQYIGPSGSKKAEELIMNQFNKENVKNTLTDFLRTSIK